MSNAASHRTGISPSTRGPILDYGSHSHSAGFSHEPRRTRSNSRSAIHRPKYSEQHEQYLKDSWPELVDSTPREDAGVAEVRTWVLKVLHRRCHPDPERALNGFHWKGRDLHSQRRYLALRLRFRREPYSYMVAHDIHDAIKESRKKARNREKEARQQRRKEKRTSKKSTHKSVKTSTGQPSNPTSPHIEFQDGVRQQSKQKKGKEEREVRINSKLKPDAHRPVRDAQPEVASAAKPKNILAKLFTVSTGQVSSEATAEAAAPPREEDPFRDPSPGPRSAKAKLEKMRKKKKATMSLDSLHGDQDPFRDPSPSPMRLVDADDFRLEN